MRKVLASACAFVVLTAAPVSAHISERDSGYLTDKQERRVARLSHEAFTADWRAHYAQDLAMCESEWRWWYRGMYDGLTQESTQAQETYGVNRGGPYWGILDQWLTFKNHWKATEGYSDPWPNC